MKLSFYGATKQVTGANYLLEEDSLKLLVDCGLFQGSRYAEILNYEPFPYDPAKIGVVLVTHSHTDHAGRLPKLYKEGFRGKIFATKPTVDLIRVALADNLDLIKDEARRDGHEPLFSADDLYQTLLLTVGVEYGEIIDVGHGTRIVFHEAGHILGSAILEIEWGMDKAAYSRIYFSGDLGNSPTPLLNNFDFPKESEYLVVESAYGDRIHEDKNRRKEILKNIIEATVKSSGTLMIPTFALERTQELLYELNELIVHGRVAKIPVFLDSPLAIKLTRVYKEYQRYFNRKTLREINSGEDIFNFPGLKLTFTSEESKAINNIKGPKIIIAGSGMSLGGRILYHEKKYLSDPNSAILFIGYQVEDSLGRQILDGNKEVKVLGQMVPVRCKVKAIGGYSAHADQTMLLKWIKSAAQGGKLKQVFVVQGEAHSSSVLARKIKDKLGVQAVVPSIGDSFEL